MTENCRPEVTELFDKLIHKYGSQDVQSVLKSLSASSKKKSLSSRVKKKCGKQKKAQFNLSSTDSNDSGPSVKEVSSQRNRPISQTRYLADFQTETTATAHTSTSVKSNSPSYRGCDKGQTKTVKESCFPSDEKLSGLEASKTGDSILEDTDLLKNCQRGSNSHLNSSTDSDSDIEKNFLSCIKKSNTKKKKDVFLKPYAVKLTHKEESVTKEKKTNVVEHHLVCAEDEVFEKPNTRQKCNNFSAKDNMEVNNEGEHRKFVLSPDYEDFGEPITESTRIHRRSSVTFEQVMNLSGLSCDESSSINKSKVSDSEDSYKDLHIPTKHVPCRQRGAPVRPAELISKLQNLTVGGSGEHNGIFVNESDLEKEGDKTCFYSVIAESDSSTASSENIYRTVQESVSSKETSVVDCSISSDSGKNLSLDERLAIIINKKNLSQKGFGKNRRLKEVRTGETVRTSKTSSIFLGSDEDTSVKEESTGSGRTCSRLNCSESSPASAEGAGSMSENKQEYSAAKDLREEWMSAAVNTMSQHGNKGKIKKKNDIVKKQKISSVSSSSTNTNEHVNSSEASQILTCQKGSRKINKKRNERVMSVFTDSDDNDDGDGIDCSNLSAGRKHQMIMSTDSNGKDSRKINKKDDLQKICRPDSLKIEHIQDKIGKHKEANAVSCSVVCKITEETSPSSAVPSGVVSAAAEQTDMLLTDDLSVDQTNSDESYEVVDVSVQTEEVEEGPVEDLPSLNTSSDKTDRHCQPCNSPSVNIRKKTSVRLGSSECEDGSFVEVVDVSIQTEVPFDEDENLVDLPDAPLQANLDTSGSHEYKVENINESDQCAETSPSQDNGIVKDSFSDSPACDPDMAINDLPPERAVREKTRQSDAELGGSQTWRQKESYLSDSSEGDDLESFLQQMRKPEKSNSSSPSPERHKSMKDFIVDDDELSSDAEESDDSCFYVRTTRQMETPESKRMTKKIQEWTESLSDDDTDEEEEEEEGSICSSEDDFSENLYPSSDMKSKGKEAGRESPKSSKFRRPPPVFTCDSSSEEEWELPDVPAGVLTARNANPPSTPVTHKTPGTLKDSAAVFKTPAAVVKTPASKYNFLKSLSTDVEDSRRHPDALRYVKTFKKYSEELPKKLFHMFNRSVFDSQLPEDLPVIWNKRLLKTAGYCAYTKKSQTERKARVELSTKVCDSAERVRDTLIHELCHAAVWLLNGTKDGHGPYWKYWAKKSNLAHPEIPVIARCHDYSINTKFTYRCTKCGYSIGRHSKSLDTDKKVCGKCHGQFELLTNCGPASGQTPGQPTATPKTPRTPNRFALFVKDNYSEIKKRDKSMKHGDVMKVLSQQFAEMNKIS